MYLSFLNPAALVLLLVLPALWALALLTPRRLASWRFWSSLLLRSMILVALVGSLSGVQLVRQVRELTTIFLIDGSDSVAPARRAEALDYVASALQELPPGDQVGIVVFGGNALVERAPSSLQTLDRLASVPLATRTNLQEALQLGLALLPADTRKRLVLLSDGGENSGHAIEAARLAAVRGVPIDIVFLPTLRGRDVIVSALEAPATAREGQEIALQVGLQSSFATRGQLLVFVDGQVALSSDVAVAEGQTTLPLRVPAGQAGFRRLEVRLEAQDDSQPQNNRAMAFTEVQGPPRLLLLASEPARAGNLQAALELAGARIDLRTPEQAPVELTQLAEYSAVVLVDTPARRLPRPLMEALPVYVREFGRGLAMVGGTESFGAGGYRRSPIAAALPVNLDPRDTSMQSDIGLAMVIDRSGSMEASSDTVGRSKLDLAKEAVYQASLGLTERDQIGLVAFDSTADWVLPLQPLPPAIELEQALSSFGPGGGTNIRPGLDAAAQALGPASARVKHIILLTDGLADSNYSDLVDQLRAQQVTISTVAIGDDADPNLRQIAERGGGRYYRVRRASDVPEIFLQETVLVAGRDLVEEDFTPLIALQAPIVRGLAGLPPLHGYNGTELKERARMILMTPDGRPLLAEWQYGLGRVVAWTSDFKGQWGRDWVGWEQFPRFVDGLLDLLLPQQIGDQLALQTTTADAQTTFELTAASPQGQPYDRLTITGRLLDPTDQPSPLLFRQVGPGRYRAVANTDTPGIYLTQISAVDQQGQAIGSLTGGVAVSYSPEYSVAGADPQLLQALARLTGGRSDPPASAAFAPPEQVVGAVQQIALPLLWLALLLWPLDIGVRRLFLRPAELRLVRRKPVLHAEQATLTRLSQAKQRATQQTTRAAPAEPLPTSTATPAPPPTPVAPLDDEQLARLMAAKRRARHDRQ